MASLAAAFACRIAAALTYFWLYPLTDFFAPSFTFVYHKAPHSIAAVVHPAGLIWDFSMPSITELI